MSRTCQFVVVLVCLLAASGCYRHHHGGCKQGPYFPPCGHLPGPECHYAGFVPPIYKPPKPVCNQCEPACEPCCPPMNYRMTCGRGRRCRSMGHCGPVGHCGHVGHCGPLAGFRPVRGALGLVHGLLRGILHPGGCGHGCGPSSGGGCGGCGSCGPHGGCGLLGGVLHGVCCPWGCGEVYHDEWSSDPPDCCEPCDHYGNWCGNTIGYRAPYRLRSKQVMYAEPVPVHGPHAAVPHHIEHHGTPQLTPEPYHPRSMPYVESRGMEPGSSMPVLPHSR